MTDIYLPEDSCYHREKDSVRMAWRKADEVAADMPEKLRKWLLSEGFEKIPTRDVLRYTISARLRKRGVDLPANRWRQSAVKELKRMKLPEITQSVAREISWRLVDMKVYDYEPESKRRREVLADKPLKKVETLEEIEGMEFLPTWMRWAVMHPALLLTADEAVTDSVVSAMVSKYEEMFPCPHQAAKNQFSLYRGDKKMLDIMFKEIAKLHLASTKMGNAPAEKAGVAEKSPEERSIQSLDDLLSSMST